jgi:hypothetical protein
MLALPALVGATLEELLEALKAIIRGQGAPPLPGNLPDVHVVPMTATEEPAPFTVLMTAAAEALHEQKLADEDVWAKRVAGTPQAAIVNRLAENATKLALTVACGDQFSLPVIARDVAAWAVAVVEHVTETLVDAVRESVSSTEYGRDVLRVLRVIVRAGPDGVTPSGIYRAMSGIQPKMRDVILNDLVQQDKVGTKASENKTGKKTIVFYAIQAVE